MKRLLSFGYVEKLPSSHFPELPYFDQNRIARMIRRGSSRSANRSLSDVDPVVIEAIRNSTAFKAKR